MNVEENGQTGTQSPPTSPTETCSRCATGSCQSSQSCALLDVTCFVKKCIHDLPAEAAQTRPDLLQRVHVHADSIWDVCPDDEIPEYDISYHEWATRRRPFKRPPGLPKPPRRLELDAQPKCPTLACCDDDDLDGEWEAWYGRNVANGLFTDWLSEQPHAEPSPSAPCQPDPNSCSALAPGDLCCTSSSNLSDADGSGGISRCPAVAASHDDADALDSEVDEWFARNVASGKFASWLQEAQEDAERVAPPCNPPRTADLSRAAGAGAAPAGPSDHLAATPPVLAGDVHDNPPASAAAVSVAAADEATDAAGECGPEPTSPSSGATSSVPAPCSLEGDGRIDPGRLQSSSQAAPHHQVQPGGCRSVADGANSASPSIEPEMPSAPPPVCSSCGAARSPRCPPLSLPRGFCAPSTGAHFGGLSSSPFRDADPDDMSAPCSPAASDSRTMPEEDSSRDSSRSCSALSLQSWGDAHGASGWGEGEGEEEEDVAVVGEDGELRACGHDWSGGEAGYQDVSAQCVCSLAGAGGCCWSPGWCGGSSVREGLGPGAAAGSSAGVVDEVECGLWEAEVERMALLRGRGRGRGQGLARSGCGCGAPGGNPRAWGPPEEEEEGHYVGSHDALLGVGGGSGSMHVSCTDAVTLIAPVDDLVCPPWLEPQLDGMLAAVVEDALFDGGEGASLGSAAWC